jgi:hypothetical protein
MVKGRTADDGWKNGCTAGVAYVVEMAVNGGSERLIFAPRSATRILNTG